MKKLILFCTLILTLNSFAAKFYEAQIFYTNGKTIGGYANLPSNHLFSGNVSFKQNENGEGEKLNDDDLQKIIYTTENGKFCFEYTQCNFLYGKNGQRVPKNKEWILMTSSNDLINTYSLSQFYFLNKDGVMVASTIDRSGSWAEVFVLFKKPNETVPMVITSFTSGAYIIGKDKKFRNSAKQFFAGEEKFIARIDAKEFESEKVHDMVKAYIAYKKTQ